MLTFRVPGCIAQALGWLNESLSETNSKLKFLSHIHTHTLNFAYNYSVLSNDNLLVFSHQTHELLMYNMLGLHDAPSKEGCSH